MILPDRRAILGLDELAGHARPHHFAQAIEVDGVDAEPPLDLGAHALGPWLGAEQADPHRGIARIDALARELVGDRQHVGRRHQNDPRTEFTDELDLALAETARHRHHGAAQPLGAVMRAQAAGEQAVTVGIVDDVARPRAAGVERARHEVGPGADVARRVAHHRRPAGGAARGMNAHALFARDGQHAVRIGIAQVGLGGEGKALEIVEVAEIVGMHPRRLALGAVRRLVLVGMAQHGLQALELQGAQRIERQSHFRKQILRHDCARRPSSKPKRR